MHEPFSNSVEVRFIDRDQVIRDLRQAVAAAKAAHPEILRVFLFGSFVQGNWTADSDADLFVVVRKEFADIFDRGSYAIFGKGYSHRFARPLRDRVPAIDPGPLQLSCPKPPCGPRTVAAGLSHHLMTPA